MAEFSATDAALNGFRVVADRPRLLLVWAPVQFALSLSLSLFVAVTAGQTLRQVAALTAQPKLDVARLAVLSANMAPTNVVVLAYLLIFGAIVNAAMNRAVFQAGNDRFGYLRLSSDELLQLGLLALFDLAFSFSLILVVGLAAALVSIGPAGQLLAALVVPASVVAFIFVAVRLSLASAMTFAAHRIVVVDSWRQTRGRFWPLFGTYVIAVALRLIVFLLTLAIATGAVGIVDGIAGAGRNPRAEDLFTVAGVLSPAGLVDLLVTAVGQALAWPIVITAPAVIYRALAGQSAGGAATRA